MNLNFIFLLLIFTIPTLSLGNTNCPIPQQSPNSLFASQKQKTSFMYRGKRYDVNFQFQRMKGHRSTPGDIIQTPDSKDQLLIAWGDMGVVQYSKKFHQMVNFIPIRELTPNHTSGEILSLFKDNKRFMAVIFNDHSLKYEKVAFQISPFKVDYSRECEKLASK